MKAEKDKVKNTAKNKIRRIEKEMKRGNNSQPMLERLKFWKSKT